MTQGLTDFSYAILQEVSNQLSQPPEAPVARLARKAIWFHHIKAVSKRKAILAWARELGVRGLSKPGFPGILLCEGAEQDIQVAHSLLLQEALQTDFPTCGLSLFSQPETKSKSCNLPR